MSWGFPGDSVVKKSACQCRRHKICGFVPWVSKIPWRRAWQPTPVFLSRESHGQRSLVGYSPWGGKGRDTTEQVRSNWNSKPWPWGFQSLYHNRCGFFFFILVDGAVRGLLGGRREVEGKKVLTRRWLQVLKVNLLDRRVWL